MLDYKTYIFNTLRNAENQLSFNNKYNLKIDGSVFESIYNVNFFGVDGKIVFTTEEAHPPVVTNILPVSGSVVNINKLNPQLIISFSEKVTPSVNNERRFYLSKVEDFYNPSNNIYFYSKSPQGTTLSLSIRKIFRYRLNIYF